MGAGRAWDLGGEFRVEKVFNQHAGSSHTLPTDSPVAPRPIGREPPTPEDPREGGAGLSLLSSPAASQLVTLTPPAVASLQTCPPPQSLACEHDVVQPCHCIAEESNTLRESPEPVRWRARRCRVVILD